MGGEETVEGVMRHGMGPNGFGSHAYVLGAFGGSGQNRGFEQQRLHLGQCFTLSMTWRVFEQIPPLQSRADMGSTQSKRRNL